MLLGAIYYNPFSERIAFVSDYLLLVVRITPLYMLFTFPVILTYGVFSSMLSDKVAKLISTKVENEKIEIIISGALHLVFGLILLLMSLGASILFFVTDRFLQRYNKKYTWSLAFMSLVIPLIVWLFYMGIVWIVDFLFVT